MPNAVNVILTAVLGFFMLDIRKKDKYKEKYFMILICILLVAVAGLRGLYAMSDTEAYHWTYIDAKSFSFFEYIKMQKIDLMYYTINWIFSNLGIPWQVYLVIESSFVFGSVCYWIYKHSEDKVMSMLIFECMFMTVWQQAIRQAIALSLILWGYHFLRKRKRKQAIAIFCISFMFHGTAIVFILYLIVRKFPINNYTLILYSLICIAGFIFNDMVLVVVNQVAKLLGRNVYLTFWTKAPMTLTTMMILVAIAAIICKKIIINRWPESSDYYCALFISIFFLSLGGGVMVRIVWYFAIFICLLIPLIIKSIKERIFLRYFCMILIITMYLSSNDFTQYYFFWQR